MEGRMVMFRFREIWRSTAYGNRTRDSSVKGMRLNPLTNAALTLKPQIFLPFRVCKDIGCGDNFPNVFVS